MKEDKKLREDKKNCKGEEKLLGEFLYILLHPLLMYKAMQI